MGGTYPGIFSPVSLAPGRIGQLLAPFIVSPDLHEHDESVSAAAPLNPAPLSSVVLEKLSAYLDLLLRWSARTNLTAIRDPVTIVQRHFGESLFLALQLRPYLKAGAMVLDFGAGAGFPGLPLQILFPELQVTLAESQGKKAAFLREAVRVLEMPTEVWASRVEALPGSRSFDAITMRAVDEPESALAEASLHIYATGTLALLVGMSSPTFGNLAFSQRVKVPVPLSERRWVVLYAQRVPRGT